MFPSIDARLVRSRRCFTYVRSATFVVFGAFVALAPAMTPRPVSAQALATIAGTLTLPATASGPTVTPARAAAGATVTLSGNNLTQSVTTDARGRFLFSVTTGEYSLRATLGDRLLERNVLLTSTGVELSLSFGDELKTIGKSTVSHAPPVAKSSGTDVVIDSQTLSKLPNANSLPSLLVTLPDAARGSNGEIHINGDHNGINYIVDGVQLPEGLNRVLGNEIDPSDIQSIDVLEGAYPAQYGDHFAAQLNIATKARQGPFGFDESVRVGAYSLFDETFGAHAPLGQHGSVTFAGRLEHDGRGIDPATQNAPHDNGSTANALLRVTFPVLGHDSVNFDLLHSTQTFQIPPDTNNGFPASQDDVEVQNDNFASLQYRHSFSANTLVSFGPSYKNSRLLDTPDPVADLAGANGSTCVDFSDCSFFSVFADRVAQDARFNVDFTTHSDRNDVRFGTLVTRDSIPKTYAITLQAGNSLSPTGSPFTATDGNTNHAYQQEAYLQDSLLVLSHLRLDVGARYDAFEIRSGDFSSAFRQISPRVKLTRDFGSRSSVYAYYGRLFTPFSFENVDPQTSAMLFAVSNAPGARYDLRPQRDSLYEAGFHVPLGAADVGVRLSHKVSTDYIDDTQVGSTNLHQDINFPRGLVDSESLYVQTPLPRNSRAYLSVSHVVAQNAAQCETQLLQNCALGGPPGGDLVQSDHDQHYDVTSGVILNDRRGDYFSATGEYGSGLSRGDTSACPGSSAINCKVPPHLTFDASQALLLGPKSFLTVGVENVFDDDYAVTLNSSLQGTHYTRPRTFFLRFDTGK